LSLLKSLTKLSWSVLILTGTIIPLVTYLLRNYYGSATLFSVAVRINHPHLTVLAWESRIRLNFHE